MACFLQTVNFLSEIAWLSGARACQVNARVLCSVLRIPGMRPQRTKPMCGYWVQARCVSQVSRQGLSLPKHSWAVPLSALSCDLLRFWRGETSLCGCRNRTLPPGRCGKNRATWKKGTQVIFKLGLPHNVCLRLNRHVCHPVERSAWRPFPRDNLRSAHLRRPRERAGGGQSRRAAGSGRSSEHATGSTRSTSFGPQGARRTRPSGSKTRRRLTSPRHGAWFHPNDVLSGIHGGRFRSRVSAAHRNGCLRLAVPWADLRVRSAGHPSEDPRTNGQRTNLDWPALRPLGVQPKTTVRMGPFTRWRECGPPCPHAERPPFSPVPLSLLHSLGPRPLDLRVRSAGRSFASTRFDAQT